MTLARLSRRAIVKWRNWISAKRLDRQTRITLRAMPEIARIARARSECRSKHRKGAANYDRQARELMTSALRGGA